jgi:hypothetical protein
LPERELPRLTSEDRKELENVRRTMQRMGLPAAEVEPTARKKWVGLLVDPDGFVWLDPWRPPSAIGDPFHALVLNPRTGALDSVQVPAFPSAFLSDYTFVAALRDETRRDIIRKYAREERGNP